MKRFYRVLLSLTLVMVLLCGCGRNAIDFTFFSPIQERASSQNSTQYTVDISPAAQSDTMQTQQATLFYRLGETELLAPMSVTFSLSVDTTIEEAILSALIDGPIGQHELTGTIPAGTELVSAKVRDGYFEVTLSSDFFSVGSDVPSNWEQDPQWVQEVQLRRKLATYSIVNSITQLGIYTRVLILIDMTGNGNGQRVERSNFGLMPQTGEEDTLIEPLARDASLLLTPNTAARLTLDALISQDSDYLSRYLYFSSGTTPDAQELGETLFQTQLSAYTLDLENGPVISLDGASAMINFSYEYITAQGVKREVMDIPLLLILDDGIWSVDYESLCAVLQ